MNENFEMLKEQVNGTLPKRDYGCKKRQLGQNDLNPNTGLHTAAVLDKTIWTQTLDSTRSCLGGSNENHTKGQKEHFQTRLEHPP